MKDAVFLRARPVFSTREFAMLTGSSVDGAAHRLGRLQKDGFVKRVVRGIWCQPDHPFFSALNVVPYLLGAEQGYVSFLTALHRHSLITQIPQSIQTATTGHGRRVKTAVGLFEFFRIQPGLMQIGVENPQGRLTCAFASPEKALIDTLYLSTRRGRRFRSLPEVDIAELDKRRLRSLISQLSPTIRAAVQAKLAYLQKIA